jgi:hypothetical protein
MPDFPTPACASAARPAQRLAAENREQQELIQQLMFRVDSLEDRIRAAHDEAAAAAARKKGFGWLLGGFSSAKPVILPAST